jgi:hypothetical protein
MRGLLLGSHNLCKLPSRGMEEAERFVAGLAPSLRASVEMNELLPEEWLERADAILVFGRDETVAHFRGLAQPWQTFIAHGHQLSLGIIFDDPDLASVAGAANDSAIFDQQGCLSPQVFYVRERGAFTARAYAERLAEEMGHFEEHTPRGALTLSEANGIRTLREEIAFRAANEEPLALLASAGGTAWTVIADATRGFPRTPLNRTIFVKPLPRDLEAEIAPVRAYLSTCGVWPPNDENRDFAMRLGATRICPVGKMQQPPVTWHHDGQQVLAPLVRWVDGEK